MSGLVIRDGWPAGLETCAAAELHARLGAPTLVYLAGRAEPPVFVSVLLHGNETSGWEGVRRLVTKHLEGATPLDRSVILLIGNVRAAAHGLRVLPDQQDYNRIWRGAHGAEGELVDAVQRALAGRELFAAVDLHNNTGHNPHYSVVTEVDAGNLSLARLFDDKAVYVQEPDTVLARVFAGRCPAVTLELGPIGDRRCDDRGFDFLARLLASDTLPPPDWTQLQIYRAEARVHVPPSVDFVFVGDARVAQLVLTSGIEAVNFHELPPGTEFAATALPASEALHVLDSARRDVTDRYFESDGRSLRLRQPVVPAMYTMDPLVVRQDCLCYFMTRMVRSELAAPEAGM